MALLVLTLQNDIPLSEKTPDVFHRNAAHCSSLAAALWKIEPYYIVSSSGLRWWTIENHFIIKKTLYKGF